MGRGRRPVRDGKRKTPLSDPLIVEDNKPIPSLWDVRLEILRVRERSATLELFIPGRQSGIKFIVTTGQVMNGDIRGAAANAIMISVHGMSGRARKKAIPAICRHWSRSDAPQWEKGIKEAKDLIKVYEVMES